jgi:intein/homing endonuclease
MSSQGKPAAALSWMVRCWEEPREQAGEEPVFRCFVRDLKTGEERYLSDPGEIGKLMLRKLREAGRTASRDQKTNQKTG